MFGGSSGLLDVCQSTVIVRFPLELGAGFLVVISAILHDRFCDGNRRRAISGTNRLDGWVTSGFDKSPSDAIGPVRCCRLLKDYWRGLQGKAEANVQNAVDQCKYEVEIEGGGRAGNHDQGGKQQRRSFWKTRTNLIEDQLMTKTAWGAYRDG